MVKALFTLLFLSSQLKKTYHLTLDFNIQSFHADIISLIVCFNLQLLEHLEMGQENEFMEARFKAPSPNTIFQSL